MLASTPDPLRRARGSTVYSMVSVLEMNIVVVVLATDRMAV